MHRSLSLRYLLFTTLLIPIIRVFSPRAESATFLFATMLISLLCNHLVSLLQKRNLHSWQFPKSVNHEFMFIGTKSKIAIWNCPCPSPQVWEKRGHDGRSLWGSVHIQPDSAWTKRDGDGPRKRVSDPLCHPEIGDVLEWMHFIGKLDSFEKIGLHYTRLILQSHPTWALRAVELGLETGFLTSEMHLTCAWSCYRVRYITFWGD